MSCSSITDHEYRIITPSVARAFVAEDRATSLLLNRLPRKPFVDVLCVPKKSDQGIYDPARDPEILSIAFRGLSVNGRHLYFRQEEELPDTFLRNQQELDTSRSGYWVAQIPNPDVLSFGEFKNFFNNRLSLLAGFELNAALHGKVLLETGYEPYLRQVSEWNLPLQLEVEHPYQILRKNFIPEYLLFRDRYPELEILLPHLGSGLFLWSSILEQTESDPLRKTFLLTSVPRSLWWLEALRLSGFNPNNVLFATDHPFNGKMSWETKLAWKSAGLSNRNFFSAKFSFSASLPRRP